MAQLFHTGTEYVANQITLLRGTVANILSVGVYHNINPNTIPAVSDFITVHLADGTSLPPDPLGETGKIDVLSLIGPRGGDVNLAAGDYQRWVCVTTATEDIIRKVDVLTIL